ncbi:MAG TPA: FAD-binding oxidoreductase [Oculatellaceae cyanobacterium]|jgi:glycolate oxidase FAD binding subunit
MAIAQTLETIFNSDTSIYNWDNLDQDLQKRITQALLPGQTPSYILYPQSENELAQAMAYAYRNNQSVVACGNGSKLGWGKSAKTQLVISTARLNHLIEHAVGDLTVTVEAGMKFAEVQNILAAANQFIALDPAYPEDATIGGIIATADAGSWRQRYGGVRDMILGLTFIRADGEIAKAGGRVVKNVAGYDLMKLFTGSYGTLGIISQVTLRVYPLPKASATVVLTGDKERIATASKTLLASALTPTAIDLVSPQLVTQLGIGDGMGLIVRFQSVAESIKQQSARLIEVGEHLGLHCCTYSDDEEANLWKKLQQNLWLPTQSSAIICKIGVKPSEAVALLGDEIVSQAAMGVIHASSGLGILRFNKPEIISKLRSLCESKGGFLSILEAPATVKENLDVWGYRGNALDLMVRIKQQFDTKNLLNPGRFVGEI